uniref:F-box domain-containing protein n=1 Tax=Caenorhabditis tropicalis TaxID=1561998 RepID=A0A1I7TQ35_9PELO
MTTPEFRCLQLPDVALREVLKNMDLTELLILSLCSQNANRVVKLNYNKSLKWTLWLCGYWSLPCIGFQCNGPLQNAIVVKEATEIVQIKSTEEHKSRDQQDEMLLMGFLSLTTPASSAEVIETKLDELVKVKVGEQKMSIAKGEDLFEVYCTDPKAGFNTILDYINDLFGDLPRIVSMNPSFLWFYESMRTRPIRTFISSKRTSEGNDVPLTEEEAR